MLFLELAHKFNSSNFILVVINFNPSYDKMKSEKIKIEFLLYKLLINNIK
jgi:hypothetical protein